MVKWKTAVIEAEDTDQSKPPVTEYIGECFLLIAERLSTRPNFVNYPFRDEMIGDAIENCLMYAANFDPEKSKNFLLILLKSPTTHFFEEFNEKKSKIQSSIS